jgi:hypothetical protein
MAEEKPELPPDILEQILASLKGLRYGSVEITLQNSKVVLIERKEKKRFGKDAKED